MNITTDLLQILRQILDNHQPDRAKLVKDFQDKVWNDETIQEEQLNEILSDIAYNLDYYEPQEERRKQSTSYYGEERLLEVVKEGLEELETYLAAANKTHD